MLYPAELQAPVRSMPEVVLPKERERAGPPHSGWPVPMERVMGIEPTQPAWKAGVLPLNYTRVQLLQRDTPRTALLIIPQETRSCQYPAGTFSQKAAGSTTKGGPVGPPFMSNCWNG